MIQLSHTCPICKGSTEKPCTYCSEGKVTKIKYDFLFWLQHDPDKPPCANCSEENFKYCYDTGKTCETFEMYCTADPRRKKEKP